MTAIILTFVSVFGVTISGPVTMSLNLLNKDTYPTALCNDGTTAGYYYSLSTSESNYWIVHLEGGHWCWDIASCNERSISSPNLCLTNALIGFILLINLFYSLINTHSMHLQTFYLHNTFIINLLLYLKYSIVIGMTGMSLNYLKSFESSAIVISYLSFHIQILFDTSSNYKCHILCLLLSNSIGLLLNYKLLKQKVLLIIGKFYLFVFTSQLINISNYHKSILINISLKCIFINYTPYFLNYILKNIELLLISKLYSHWNSLLFIIFKSVSIKTKKSINKFYVFFTLTGVLSINSKEKLLLLIFGKKYLYYFTNYNVIHCQKIIKMILLIISTYLIKILHSYCSSNIRINCSKTIETLSFILIVSNLLIESKLIDILKELSSDTIDKYYWLFLFIIPKSIGVLFSYISINNTEEVLSIDTLYSYLLLYIVLISTGILSKYISINSKGLLFPIDKSYSLGILHFNVIVNLSYFTNYIMIKNQEIIKTISIISTKSIKIIYLLIELLSLLLLAIFIIKESNILSRTLFNIDTSMMLINCVDFRNISHLAYYNLNELIQHNYTFNLDNLNVLYII